MMWTYQKQITRKIIKHKLNDNEIKQLIILMSSRKSKSYLRILINTNRWYYLHLNNLRILINTNRWHYLYLNNLRIFNNIMTTFEKINWCYCLNCKNNILIFIYHDIFFDAFNCSTQKIRFNIKFVKFINIIFNIFSTSSFSIFFLLQSNLIHEKQFYIEKCLSWNFE